MRTGRRLLLALGALLALSLPATTLADGDPASDVLLGESVFYPYQPAVSASLQKTLNAETAAAQRAKFPIKVALIASPIDLGVIPDLLGKPQQYADFLDQEISFQGKQPLLVVMSTGYGIQGMQGSAASAAALLAKPARGQSDALAQAAITAVAKLATATGHPIQGVPGIPGASSSNGGATTVIVIVLALAAVATASALASITMRRRRAPA